MQRHGGADMPVLAPSLSANASTSYGQSTNPPPSMAASQQQAGPTQEQGEAGPPVKRKPGRPKGSKQDPQRKLNGGGSGGKRKGAGRPPKSGVKKYYDPALEGQPGFETSAVATRKRRKKARAAEEGAAAAGGESAGWHAGDNGEGTSGQSQSHQQQQASTGSSAFDFSHVPMQSVGDDQHLDNGYTQMQPYQTSLPSSSGMDLQTSHQPHSGMSLASPYYPHPQAASHLAANSSSFSSMLDPSLASLSQPSLSSQTGPQHSYLEIMKAQAAVGRESRHASDGFSQYQHLHHPHSSSSSSAAKQGSVPGPPPPPANNALSMYATTNNGRLPPLQGVIAQASLQSLPRGNSHLHPPSQEERFGSFLGDQLRSQQLDFGRQAGPSSDPFVPPPPRQPQGQGQDGGGGPQSYFDQLNQQHQRYSAQQHQSSYVPPPASMPPPQQQQQHFSAPPPLPPPQAPAPAPVAPEPQPSAAQLNYPPETPYPAPLPPEVASAPLYGDPSPAAAAGRTLKPRARKHCVVCVAYYAGEHRDYPYGKNEVEATEIANKCPGRGDRKRCPRRAETFWLGNARPGKGKQVNDAAPKGRPESREENVSGSATSAPAGGEGFAQQQAPPPAQMPPPPSPPQQQQQQQQQHQQQQHWGYGAHQGHGQPFYSNQAAHQQRGSAPQHHATSQQQHSQQLEESRRRQEAFGFTMMQ